MHGDHQNDTPPGPAGLPPFVARPADEPPSPGGERPLPPWSSAGHEIGGDRAGEEPAISASDAAWTAADEAAAPEPWAEAPQAAADEQSAFPDEPWPGLEPEPVAGGSAPEEDPWAAPPEPAADEEPWAAADAHDTDPWSTEPAEPEPLLLDQPTEEPLVLDEASATEPWLEGAEQAGEDAGAGESWLAGTAEGTGDVGAEDEPWSDEVASAPAADAGSAGPPAPSPLDELVETAGQALAGGSSGWVEAPLDTWPGEAEAWDAVATPAEVEAVPARDDGGDVAGMADALERLAGELRSRGADALDMRGRDPLVTALSAFLAGWRAARRAHE